MASCATEGGNVRRRMMAVEGPNSPPRGKLTVAASADEPKAPVGSSGRTRNTGRRIWPLPGKRRCTDGVSPEATMKWTRPACGLGLPLHRSLRRGVVGRQIALSRRGTEGGCGGEEPTFRPSRRLAQRWVVLPWVPRNRASTARPAATGSLRASMEWDDVRQCALMCDELRWTARQSAPASATERRGRWRRWVLAMAVCDAGVRCMSAMQECGVGVRCVPAMTISNDCLFGTMDTRWCRRAGREPCCGPLESSAGTGLTRSVVSRVVN